MKNHTAIRLEAEKVQSEDGKTFTGPGGAYTLARHLQAQGADPADRLTFVWQDGRSSVSTTIGAYAAAMWGGKSVDPACRKWKPFAEITN